MEDPKPSNLAELLSSAAREDGHRLALVEATSGRRVTWRELDDLADRVASGLAAAGIVGGYRLALALPNRIEFVAAYLGALRSRVVVVPLNPRSTASEARYVVEDSGARVVVADESTLEVALETGLPVVLVGDSIPQDSPDRVCLWSDLIQAMKPAPPLPDDVESLAVLLYTSGTTGRPRGAMLTHRALLANIDQVAAVEPAMMRPDDVVFGVLPLFHVYGLNAVLGQALRQHCRMVLVEDFDPEESLMIIEDEATSVVPIAPPVLAHWRRMSDLSERLRAVRILLSGSAPIAPELLEEFFRRGGLKVHQGYSLTEAAPVVTSTLCRADAAGTARTAESTAGSKDPADPRHPGVTAGAVGVALPGVEMRLVDQSGLRCEGEDLGEIWVRGPNLFSGFWPDGDGGPDGDGWYATGDVGFLDGRTGELILVDRLKEVVIVSGFNVYPSEVEEAIRSVPGVSAVAVAGVPDETTGEAVVAYVVPRAGIDYVSLQQAVTRACADRLARFKRPAQVEVVDELAKTVTGRVRKHTLRATMRRARQGLLE